MKQRKDLLDLAFALLITGVSLYPLYRDDIARLRTWAQAQMPSRRRDDAALRQAQREISWMEHEYFGGPDGA